MEHYRRHRHRTTYPVHISTPHGKTRLDIIDVNDQGARLKGRLDVRVGENLTIPILYMNVRAKVQWVGEGYIGVIFTPPLTKGQLSTISFGVRQVPGQRFNTAGLQELS